MAQSTHLQVGDKCEEKGNNMWEGVILSIKTFWWYKVQLFFNKRN